MNAIQTTAAAVLCLITAAYLSADEPKPDPREQLDTAIPEAIRLLEAKEHKTFLKDFVAPADLERITKNIPLDQLAERFGTDKADVLLGVLKSIKGAQPTLDAAKTRATFKLKEPIGGKEDIRWVKVEKNWYIEN